MIRIDAATVLVQWAAGGWVFLWVTTRRREVGLGYGWLQRTIFVLMAAGSLVAALATQAVSARDAATVAFMAAGGVALVVRTAGKTRAAPADLLVPAACGQPRRRAGVLRVKHS